LETYIVAFGAEIAVAMVENGNPVIAIGSKPNETKLGFVFVVAKQPQGLSTVRPMRRTDEFQTKRDTCATSWGQIMRSIKSNFSAGRWVSFGTKHRGNNSMDSAPP
jgi:hypothetical protein